ncbi:MAG: SirB1 family protein [Leptothrix ochracea]|uniref:SirB1 family protein n=1 Tax=Leptothrix ochracea TaxID=735331 RepID=UPI0034E1A5FE
MNWTVVTPIDYFAALVAEDEGFALTEAALSIAQDEYPDLDVQHILTEIDALALSLRQHLSVDDSPLQRVRVLHQFFFEECGFSCNQEDYYNPANSYVHEVLRTRRGIPITLAVIYLELAGQIGLIADGVSFPGHFLIRLRLPLGDAIIDPTSGTSLSKEAMGERLEPYLARSVGLPAYSLADYLRAASPREVMARLLRNLESIHRNREDWSHVLAVQGRMVSLEPQAWERYRDRGLTLARLGQNEAAIQDLGTYLRHAQEAPDWGRIDEHRQLLQAAQLESQAGQRTTRASRSTRWR